MTNKKHSLRGTGRVQVPAALLSKASKRSKQAHQSKSGKINSAPTAVVLEDPTTPALSVQVPDSAVTAPGETPTTATPGAALPTADVAQMMRMLKELSAQVEEVRAALVKHDNGELE